MLRDRVLASCAGDEEQADLVMDLLGRKRRPSQGRLTPPEDAPGALSSDAALPAELICANCKVALDDCGFCDCCGIHLNVRRSEC